MTKTLTFAAVHFCVAFSVAWIITGDVVIGGLLAMVEPAVNTVAYFFHEKAWQKFGRRSERLPQNSAGKAVLAG